MPRFEAWGWGQRTCRVAVGVVALGGQLGAAWVWGFGVAERAYAQDCDGWVAIGEPGPRAMAAMAYNPDRQRVVMFGGSPDYFVNSTSTTISQSETWEFDGTRWRFVTLEGPSARVGAAMGYDRARGVMVLFGGYDRVNSRDLNDTWEYDGRVWVQRQAATPTSSPDRPTARSLAAVGYDGDSRRMILAGGTNRGTWAWDGAGGTWTQLVPAASDPAYGPFASIITDPVTGHLLFTGQGAAALWNGAGWDSVAGGSRPYGTTSVVVEPGTGTVLAMSGSNSSVFAWTGSGWSYRTPAFGARSPTINGAGWCVHEASGTVVVMAVSSTGSQYLNSGPYQFTYSRSAGFVPRGADPAPEAAYGVALAYDPTRGACVLFGGDTGTTSSAASLSDQTWALRGERWELLASGLPAARRSAAMAFDPSRGRLLLTGGLGVGYSASGGETFELSDGAWQVTSIPARVFGADWHMVADPGRGRMLMISRSGNFGAFELRAGAWAGLTLTGATASVGPFTAAAMEPARGGTGSLLLAGATFGSACWIDGASVAVVSTSAIADRTSHYQPMMVHDAGRGAMVLTGGFQAASNLTPAPAFPSDTWLLPTSAPAFTRAAFRSPAGRKFHGLVYDELAQRVVMCGGSDHSAMLRETWKLARGPAGIAAGPVPTLAGYGATARLSGVARGGGVIEYRWSKDGVDVVNGGRVSGADTDTLLIRNAGPADVGDYTLAVSNPCGRDVSAPARLTVACRADADVDGARTIDDVFVFLNLWFAGCVGQPGGACGGRSADADVDGARTINDIFVFLNVWFAGC